MLKKRIWLTFLIISVSLLGIVVFWTTLQQALSPQQPKIQSGNQSLKSTDEFIGMIIRIPGAEKNGYWELHVNKVESFDDVGRLNIINGDYILNKKPVYQISGKSGTIFWENRILKVSGDVMLKTSDDTKVLTASEITWDPNMKIVKAKQSVILKAPGLTVTSDEINSNLALDQIAFAGPTKIVYMRADHE